jgi:hypothetical protein
MYKLYNNYDDMVKRQKSLSEIGIYTKKLMDEYTKVLDLPASTLSPGWSFDSSPSAPGLRSPY